LLAALTVLLVFFFLLNLNWDSDLKRTKFIISQLTIALESDFALSEPETILFSAPVGGAARGQTGGGDARMEAM